MNNSRPSRRDLQAFNQALREAAAGPRITDAYLRELAIKRDQHLARLASWSDKINPSTNGTIP